ncbi:MAG: hypothetical protein ACOCWA_05565 [Bacteroidota bacterium]
MAQNHIILAYDYSVPLGNTKDYIDANSFRGGSFEFGHHLTERMAIGLKVGLHTFYQELEKDTYTDDNVTIYGKQFRYMNSFPSLATFQYNIVDMKNDLITFVKLGIGGYYFQKRTDLGLYTFTNIYNWSFGFQPEIGVLKPFTRNIGLSINGRYNFLLKNQELDAQNYFTVSIGLVFMNLGQQGMNE